MVKYANGYENNKRNSDDHSEEFRFIIRYVKNLNNLILEKACTVHYCCVVKILKNFQKLEN